MDVQEVTMEPRWRWIAGVYARELYNRNNQTTPLPAWNEESHCQLVTIDGMLGWLDGTMAAVGFPPPALMPNVNEESQPPADLDKRLAGTWPGEYSPAQEAGRNERSGWQLIYLAGKDRRASRIREEQANWFTACEAGAGVRFWVRDRSSPVVATFGAAIIGMIMPIVTVWEQDPAYDLPAYIEREFAFCFEELEAARARYIAP